MPLPERIANAPELQLGLDLFYTAFMDLTSCRSIGMSEGPIPWTAMQEWCEANDVVGEQREDLFYYVQNLDQAYLEWSAKQLAAKAKAAPTGGKRPKGLR